MATQQSAASAVAPEISTTTTTRLVAWIAWLVPVTLTTIGLIVLVATLDQPFPSDVWGFRGYSAIISLTCASVGAIILAHRPQNVISWLFVAIAVLGSLQFLAEDYLAFAIVAAPGSMPATDWVAWLMNWLWIPQFVIMICFFLVFPDGHLLSARWGVVASIAIIAGVMGVTLMAFMPGPLIGFRAIDNPMGFGDASTYPPPTAAYRIGILTAFALAALSLVVRYRRGGPVERLQLRWVAFAAIVAAILSPLGFTDLEAGQALFIVALCGLPIAAAVAILRYHLYDIDTIINRTIVYVALTAILAGIYTASVALMQRVFVVVTGERSDAVFVVTTLIVVIVFTPAKNALQSVVDRHFKEVRDPTAPLAAFVDQLREGIWRLEPDLALHRLLAVAIDSLAASGGAVELGGRSVARTGSPVEGAGLEVAAGTGSGRIALAVGPRSAGAPYEARDRAALDAAVGAVADALKGLV
jgi:hypothetical protein